jgi:GNAT superfamily N-acetyltransferase
VATEAALILDERSVQVAAPCCRVMQPHEVALAGPLGLAFYEEVGVPMRFEPPRFEEFWRRMIDTGTGFMIGYFSGKKLIGAAGGLVTPDPYDGVTTATEMFLYVDKESRQGIGLFILRKWEEVAKKRGAQRLSMVSLALGIGPQFERILERFGYRPLETHWIKEVE